MSRKKKKTKKRKSKEFRSPKVVIQLSFADKDKTSRRTKGPFKLVRSRRHKDSWDNRDYTEWVLKAKQGKTYRDIGNIQVMPVLSENTGASPAISYVEMHDLDFQGLGLMSRCYRLLANHYGGLESDPNGNTSKEAKRIWLSLKAKRLTGKRYRIEAEKK